MAPESVQVAGARKEIQPKVYISYSRNDQSYLKRYLDFFGELYITDYMAPGDIGSDSSTEYIQRLVQGDKISVVHVVIVLVGKDTWGRKNVDWEIAAALTKKTDGFSGLMGLCLPNHPAYRHVEYKPEIVPYRLVDNIRSGYAKLYDWTESEDDVRSWVKDAFQARINRVEMIDNSRPQYTDSWSAFANWPPEAAEPELVEPEPAEDAEKAATETEDAAADKKSK